MRDFDQQMKAGHTPVFDASRFADLNIDKSAWAIEDTRATLATARQTTTA